MLLPPLVSLLLVAAPAEAGCLPLAPGHPDGNYVVPGVRGAIPYRRVDGVELLLDAYVQRGGGARPGVLVVHGGGLTAGSRVAFVGQILEALTRAGFNWFSLDYRLGGAAGRDALDDVRAALAFVRCHAGALGLDPARLAVLGEDSGAWLAAHLAAEKPPGLRAAALVGGVYEKPTVLPVPAGMPPVLVVHGTADSEVPPAQATRYCEAVRAAGGPCRYEPVAEGIHRAENWRPAQWGYKERLARWLADRLDLPSARHVPHPGGPLQKDVVYDAERGLRLDAWVPPGDGPFPGVVLVHGGGWEAGDKVTYITPLFEPLARAGFAWFSIDYRLTPDVRHPEQMGDLRRAVAFVRASAARFRVDPARLAVVGESASGQMAALLASEDRGLAAVVSFYGVYDFPAMVTDASPRSLLRRLFGRETLDGEARALLERYSPVYHVAKGQPPILLIHGTNERLWAQGVAMRDRLAGAGVPHELVALEGAPHGMENWEGRPEWAGYKRTLVEWLGQRLRERPRAAREAP